MALSIFGKTYNDPLGLGIKKQIPESPKFTKEENDTFFTRSLLSEQEKASLDEEGILSIENVRALICENMVKAQESYEGAYGLDPDLLILIDSRIDYKIYIIDDNVYLFEELYMAYPFQEFNVTPESVMVRQDIGFFTNGETIVVDAGDEIIAVDDLVGLATKKNYTMKNKPEKVVNSKIYVGKEKWKDFAQLHKFFRGIARISNMQIENSETPAFLKPFTSAFCNNAICNDTSNITSDITSNDITCNNINEKMTKIMSELYEIKDLANLLTKKIKIFEENYKVNVI